MTSTNYRRESASATNASNEFVRNVKNIFNTLDNKLEKNVKEHLKNVYGTLAIGLVAAAAGAYVHVFTNILKGNLLTTLVSIALLLLLYATPPNRGNNHLRIAYFLGFTTLAGLGTGPLLDLALDVNPSIIVSAFLSTCMVFGSFTLAALYAPDMKFLYLGGVLMSAMSLLMFVTLFAFNSFMWSLSLYGGLVITCGLILYDTQMIIEKRRRGDDDYLWHTIELFIDFMDIFRRLLIIFVQKEDGKKRKN